MTAESRSFVATLLEMTPGVHFAAIFFVSDAYDVSAK